MQPGRLRYKMGITYSGWNGGGIVVESGLADRIIKWALLTVAGMVEE
jgi:hypothetical protein